MKKNPKITIIIPLYVIEDRFFEDLKKFNKLTYSNYEIIIVSDKKVELEGKKVKLLLTGEEKTGPAEKRDLALKHAKGEICAFIDDDAYPDSTWLTNAVKEFENNNVEAVGGPGLTPKEDGFWEQLTGLVYSSFFCGGFAMYRFVKGKKQFVVDYPAYNLLVKTDALKDVGGYGSYFYGGEDTFLCLKLVKKGYKILYSPKVVVYHHRRALYVPYLKQIANVGKHRGYFAKKFPETSFDWTYFVPSILAIGFFSGLFLSFLNELIRIVYVTLLLVFLSIASGSVFKKTSLPNSFLVGVGILLTHLIYGYFFIRGLMTNKLDK